MDIHPAWAVYATGVLTGLLLGDAPPLTRVGLALTWPLGPLAFIVTVVTLLVVSPLAFIKSR